MRTMMRIAFSLFAFTACVTEGSEPPTSTEESDTQPPIEEDTPVELDGQVEQLPPQTCVTTSDCVGMWCDNGLCRRYPF